MSSYLNPGDVWHMQLTAIKDSERKPFPRLIMFVLVSSIHENFIYMMNGLPNPYDYFRNEDRSSGKFNSYPKIVITPEERVNIIIQHWEQSFVMDDFVKDQTIKFLKRYICLDRFQRTALKQIIWKQIVLDIVKKHNEGKKFRVELDTLLYLFRPFYIPHFNAFDDEEKEIAFVKKASSKLKDDLVYSFEIDEDVLENFISTVTTWSWEINC